MKTNLTCITILLGTQFLSAQSLTKEKELIITAGPSMSKLINTNIDKDEYKMVDKQSGINFQFSYNKYFKDRVGFGIGIGFSNYKQTVYQKGLFVKDHQIDKDGYEYDIWMKSDMTYTANLKYLDVPITLHLLLGSAETYYGFIDVGIVNGFLIGGKYTKDGSIENMGAYPTSETSPNPYFYVLSHNNPYYNHQIQTYGKEYTDTYKFYNVSFRASVGVAAAMTDRLFLRIAPEITKGFSDIAGEDDKGKDYENVFGEKSTYKPTKTFSLGLNVGLSFNL